MHRPVQQYSRVENSSSDMRQRLFNTPCPSLSKDPSSNAAPKKTLTTTTIMALPLVFQAAISIAITFVMLVLFNHSQYFLERHPTVPLADGTSIKLGGYNLLQSDITTLLSVSLVILRWVAGAWAGPLCWRVICLLGESRGVQRQDIRWASSRGILPPSTYFRHPLAFVLGIILLVSTVPQAFSPLLTGSIMWEPITLQLDPIPGHSQPTVNILEEYFSENVSEADVPMAIARDYVLAWGNSSETNVSRRVIPSIAGLSVNSTLANVTLPYLHTSVDWYRNLPIEMGKRLNGTLFNGQATLLKSRLMSTRGSIWLITDQEDAYTATSWYLILNVGASRMTTDTCQDDFGLGQLPGKCFAIARVWFNATSGPCINCRVISQSVVQNDTDLQPVERGSTWMNYRVARMLPDRIPEMAALTSLLPPLEANPTLYVQTFLSRAYCSLWSTTTEMASVAAYRQTTYSPPLSALKAQVDIARVFAWLGVQLAATAAGLVFLYLQSRSKHPLIEDTSMVAFDMDTSDAPKPRAHEKSEPKAFFMIERDGDGWKVVVNTSLDSSTIEGTP